MNKRQKGSVIELKCIERFLQYGFNVSIPYGDSARYDFIVDFNGTLKRFQCKSGTFAKNKLMLYTASSHITGNGVEKKRYTSEDTDYFCTCFNDTLYVIPIDEVHSTTFVLTFCNSDTNVKKIHNANDYVGHKVLKQYIDNDSFETRKELVVKCRESAAKNEVSCCRCGKKIKVGHLARKPYMCQWCRIIEKKHLIRPTKEELETFIASDLPYRVLEEKYHATAQAIKQWIIHYGLQVPDRLHNNGKNLMNPETRKKALENSLLSRKQKIYKFPMPIQQIDINGNIVGIYYSPSEIRENDMNVSLVHQVARGVRASYRGCLWRYLPPNE